MSTTVNDGIKLPRALSARYKESAGILTCREDVKLLRATGRASGFKKICHEALMSIVLFGGHAWRNSLTPGYENNGDKKDFAYPTVKDRMPVILTKVIDTVVRMKSDAANLHGQIGLDDLKLIVSDLSQLKNEMATDKPLAELTDALPDCSLWNKALMVEKERMKTEITSTPVEAMGGKNRGVPSWFSSPWLHVECLMYRKIASAISQCTKLKDLDPFRGQKQAALTGSAAAVVGLTEHTHSSLTSIESCDILLDQLLHVALWGNKCDLSISSGTENHQTTDPLSQVEPLTPFVLHDDSAIICKHLLNLQALKKNNQSKRIRVDIVLDNAGFELVTDLCLAELLISKGLADVVYFHCKAMPWFVSDVTLDDFNWTLRRLSVSSATFGAISCSSSLDGDLGNAKESGWGRDGSIEDPDSCGSRWRKFVDEGRWILRADTYWTLPHDFAQMASVSPDLYADLSLSDLILFKGDLNYRKLIGDLRWNPTDSFQTALRGFSPAPLAALRTLKCDVVVGLEPGKAEQAAAKDSDWMLNGTYGVIQFFQPITEN